MLSTIMITCGVVVALLAASRPGRRLIKNTIGLGEAKVDKLGRNIGKLAPVDRLNKLISDARANLREAGGHAAAAKAEVLSRNREKDTLQNRKEELERRIQSIMAKGDTNNTARTYALELSRVETQLPTVLKQCGQLATKYEEYCSQVSGYAEQIREAEAEAKRLALDLKFSESGKQFAAQIGSFNPGNLGSEIAEQREAVLRQIDENNAQAGVPDDIDGTRQALLQDIANERNDRADEILQRFLPQAEKPKAISQN